MKTTLKRTLSTWLSANILDSLPIFIACNLAALLIWQLNISAHTMPLILGIIAAGLSDLDNRLTGRLKNLFFTLIAFSISSLSSQLALSHGWLFVPLVTFIAFAVVMLGAIGNRYRTIAFGTLLVSVYTTLAYMPGQIWYANTLLIVAGALLYGLVSMLVYLLFPNRAVQENVAQYFEALSDYLKLKASIFDPDDTDNLPAKQLALAKANSLVMGQFDKARVSLFYRLKDLHRYPRTQRLLRYYFAGQEIWERASSSHSQYQPLFQGFVHSDLIFRLQRILTQQAEECRQIAHAIRYNEAYQPSPLGEKAGQGMQNALAFHRSKGVKNLYKLQTMAENLQNIEGQFRQLAAQQTALSLPPKSSRLIGENVSGLRNMWRVVKGQCNLSSQLFRHALRLAAVVFVCSSLVEFFELNMGYWILLTAILVCQPNYSATKKRLVQRVIGTVVGVVIGLSFRYLSPSLEAQLGMIVASSTLFFFFRNNRYSFSVLFITVQVLISFDVIGLGANEAMLPRIFDTLLGVAIAWVGVAYIFPDWKYTNLHTSLKQTLKDSALYLRHIVAQLQFGYQDQLAYRIVRRSAQNSVANLSTAVSNMLSEPVKYREALTFAPTLLELSHTLLSYIAALGAHRQESSQINHQIDFSAVFFKQSKQVSRLLEALATGQKIGPDLEQISQQLKQLANQTQADERANLLSQQLELIVQVLPQLEHFVQEERRYHKGK
ncbi:TIGR01666 family membrane protein [Pasteurellaceae bacterium RH1A]|nr:TIGR01666 family membrane protein [Pasteurellaceae bacterium RH1A]